LGWVLRACLGAAIVLIAVYAIAWRWLGTSEAAWALLHGDEIVVIPATVDLGDCLAGDAKELELRVVNLSSSRVTLTGVHTSCSCILASALPEVLEPRGASTLRMTVHASGDRGSFARQAVLYTDSKASPQLPIVVVGRILEDERNADLEPIPQEANSRTSSDG
jgi:hypothetical protein